MQRNREPNLTEVLQSQDEATSARIRVAMPAKILSFDGKHTVTAQIMIKQNVNGQHVTRRFQMFQLVLLGLAVSH